MGNPLVADVKSSTEAYTGISLLESAHDLKSAIETGEWASVAMGSVGTALDALSMAMDPFGAALAAGVGWLIEHCGPLKEALDALAGDPDQITANSETWANVATELGGIGEDLTSMVNNDLVSWTGVAADAYRQRAADTVALLGSAKEGSEGASSGVKTAGEVVAAVRALVRDIIAELIGHMISWALQVVLTLGIGLTWVIGEVTAAVAKTASQIANITGKLMKALKALIPLLKKAGDLFADAAKALKNVKGGKGAPTRSIDDLPPSPKAPDTLGGGKGGGDTTPSSSTPPPAKDPAPDSSTTPPTPPPPVRDSGPDGSTTPSSTPPPLRDSTPDGSTTPSSAPPPLRDSTPDGSTTPSSSGGGKGDSSPGGGSPDAPPPPRSIPEPPPVPKSLDTPPPKTGAPKTGTPKGDGTKAQGTRGIKDANTKPRENDTPTVDRTACGDPIDVSTGRVMLTQDDVELAGILPLLLSRTHLSSYRIGRSFGPSWASTVDQRLEIDDEGAYFAAEDGTLLTYPRPAPDVEVLPLAGPRWPLTRTDDGSYVLHQPNLGRTLFFGPGDAHDRPITGISDARGHSIHFDRADGLLTEIRHSAGYRVGVLRDGALITSLVMVSGGQPIALVRYRYDDRGNLAEVLNSSAKPLSFEYDAEGRLVRWVDRNGMWYSYAYDAEGRCVTAKGAGGYLDYTLSYEDLRTTAVDSLGHTRVFGLNSFLQVVAETDPLGNVELSEWDAYDRLLSRTDALGRTTRYRYDERGLLVATVWPDGVESTTEYDDEGRPVRTVEADQGVWLREYGPLGTVSAVTDPAGARTTYEYDADGRLRGVTDPLGETTRVENDGAGLPIAVTDPLGATTRYRYDRFGRPFEVTDPLGGVTRSSWTVEGKPLTVTTPDGATERWSHDGEGNLRELVDAQNLPTRTAFAHFDLPTSRTAPDGSRVELAYDTELRLTSVTNQQGLVWRYRYDGSGNLVWESDFNGRERHYRYDSAGQLVEQINAAGQAVRLTRDALGRVVRREDGEAISTYAFDAAGRLLNARNADAELAFVYDATGRVLSETVNGKVLSSEYDCAGRRVRRVTPTGAVSTWEYDAAGRPAALHSSGQTLRFRFDRAGREVERRIGAATVLRQAWDTGHRLNAQTLLAGAGGAGPVSLVQRRAYGYRPDGVLSSVDDLLDGRRTYDLDNLGQVTGVRGENWTEQYAYDSTGNVTRANLPAQDVPADHTYTGNLVKRAGAAEYEYDAEGRVVVWRVSPSAAWHYTWDAEDRLVGVLTPDGQRWRYRYDPLGRRIAKEQLGTGAEILDRTTFSWDGSELAEEISNDVRALVWDWDPAADRVLTQNERLLGQGTGLWQDHRFHAVVTDAAGVPVELVDRDGTLSWHGRHTLWGLSAASGGEAVTTPLRFPGQYHDRESGLHYNFYRYYNPVTARYASADPLGLEAAVNQYAYVSNPTGWVDPLGLVPCKLPFKDSHSTPGGSALDLRGPRKSGKPGRTDNKVRDQDKFNSIADSAGVKNPNKDRLSFHKDPQTMVETNQGLNKKIRDEAVAQGKADMVDSNNKAIEKMGRSDPNTKPFWEMQDRRDAHTANQANERAANSQPDPALDADTDKRLGYTQTHTQGAQALLSKNDGVVLGGGHGETAPWNFLQENMAQLKDTSGLNKIYLESLRGDAYQGHVDDFMKSPAGTDMHPDLKTFLDHPNNHGMRDTIVKAKEVGDIDVVGVGGNPARRGDMGGPESLYQRHAMFNSYAAEAIEHNQAANPGKYIMEVGSAHGKTENWTGAPVKVGGVSLPGTSPGLGQLLGVPAVMADGHKFSRIK